MSGEAIAQALRVSDKTVAKATMNTVEASRSNLGAPAASVIRVAPLTSLP